MKKKKYIATVGLTDTVICDDACGMGKFMKKRQVREILLQGHAPDCGVKMRLIKLVEIRRA